jgi:hypothetical protein
MALYKSFVNTSQQRMVTCTKKKPKRQKKNGYLYTHIPQPPEEISAMMTTGTFDDHQFQPPHPEPCTNRLCAQFRLQHRNMTLKRNELEKELEAMRRKHDTIYNQVVTRGEASMMREAATGEGGVRLPNGEVMTAEKYIAKTKMMNQCRESLQASEKKARLLTDENTHLKHEKDSLYTTMRKYENMLQGFERSRQFEVFTDDAHRATLEENAKLVEHIDRMRRVERETREENAALRRRMQVYKKNEILANSNNREGSGSPSMAAMTAIPRKITKRRMGSDDE